MIVPPQGARLEESAESPSRSTPLTGRRILGGVTEQGPPTTGRGRPAGPVVVAIVWAIGSVAAFALLDPVIATFAVILGLTGVGVAFVNSDWVRSTTFEEREAERVRRRKAKWDAGAPARARDRARWEAHRARRAGNADG